MVTDIAARVRKVIVMHHLAAEETKITEDAKFIDDLEADSLDVVELVISFEEEFNILIPDYVTEKLVTVGDAVAFITEARRATRPFFARGIILPSATRLGSANALKRASESDFD